MNRAVLKVKIPILVKIILLILFILICDQVLKIWVKTHMMEQESIAVFGNWFYLYFIENEGMAFGMKIIGKLFLTLFRIVAIIAIAWYLYHLIKKKMPQGFLLTIALILAGAIGNIIDSVFYGVIFNGSQRQVATMFPEEGGYTSWLHGNVVDMLYIPLFEGHFPSWFPIWSTEHFTFFAPIFNIADSAITIAVVILLVFYRKQFSEK